MEWRFSKVISDLCSLKFLITKKGEGPESHCFRPQRAFCDFASHHHFYFSPFFWLLLEEHQHVGGHPWMVAIVMTASPLITLFSKVVKWSSLQPRSPLVLHRSRFFIDCSGTTRVSLTPVHSEIRSCHVPCQSAPHPKSQHFCLFVCLSFFFFTLLRLGGQYSTSKDPLCPAFKTWTGASSKQGSSLPFLTLC